MFSVLAGPSLVLILFWKRVLFGISNCPIHLERVLGKNKANTVEVKELGLKIIIITCTSCISVQHCSIVRAVVVFCLRN